jgi:hypothetical protein
LKSEGCGKKARTVDFSYSDLYKMEMMKVKGGEDKNRRGRGRED